MIEDNLIVRSRKKRKKKILSRERWRIAQGWIGLLKAEIHLKCFFYEHKDGQRKT